MVGGAGKCDALKVAGNVSMLALASPAKLYDYLRAHELVPHV